MMPEDFENLINGAMDARETFGRDLRCKIYRADGGVLAISRLVDRFHDIELTVFVDRSNFKITQARVKMEKVPYEICKETMSGVENLCDLFIFHPAINREVRRRIKRKDGCTHLFELIEFTFQSLFSGGPLAGLGNDETVDSKSDLPAEEHRRLQAGNPRLHNTCRAFVQDE